MVALVKAANAVAVKEVNITEAPGTLLAAKAVAVKEVDVMVAKEGRRREKRRLRVDNR